MEDILGRLIQIGVVLIVFGVVGYVLPFSRFLDVVELWLIVIGACILGIALLVAFIGSKRTSQKAQ